MIYGFNNKGHEFKLKMTVRNFINFTNKFANCPLKNYKDKNYTFKLKA